MSDQKKGFWSSIPGMLTGLAAVITAVTGLVVAISTSDIASLIKGGDTGTGPPITDVGGMVDGLANEGPTNVMPITVIDDGNPDSGAITLDALVDCKLFPTENTVTSLMGWSDHYQKQIINAGPTKDACNKAIAYRAQAHCKNRSDLAIRQGLAENLSHCEKIKFTWKDVQL